MGAVYAAHDPVLGRDVAVKTVLGAHELDPEQRLRFEREARSAARLQHPNIVTVFDLGDADGVPYLAMELLDGEPLSAAMAELLRAPLDERLEIVQQICRGLAYAHRRGVVHRDIKPGNVFCLTGGGVKIVDFGIARLEDGVTATRTGQLLGTPGYMSPEQFNGEPADARSDQWAVGVILYELLTGQTPFRAPTVPALIYKVVHEPVPQLEVSSGCPQRLLAVVRKVLDKSPQERYADLGSVEAELASIRSELDRSQAPTVHMASAPAPPEEAIANRGGRAPDRVSFTEVATFGEPHGLNVLAPDPRGRWLAAGGTDGSIRLWDVAGRSRIADLRASRHVGMTTSLAFSPDGTLLASGHLDGSIVIWETRVGEALPVRLGHPESVTGLAFTPDGGQLVSGALDCTVKLWEVPALRTGEGRRMMRRQPTAVTALALTSDGACVVTGHSGRGLRVHDLDTLRLVATVHGLSAAPSAIVSVAGGELAVAARDGALAVVDVGQRRARRRWAAVQRSLVSLALLPGQGLVAGVAQDPRLIVWRFADGSPVCTLWGREPESFASVVALDEGQVLVAGLADGRLRVWRAVGG
jgi:hypothetical protein